MHMAYRADRGRERDVTKSANYDVPDGGAGGLGLKGPVDRPAPGTLPLRGDLAHIALADRYLVPHYVVPQMFVLAGNGAMLKLTADAAAADVILLAGGSQFEVLDLAGDWYWGCVGPGGPSGYLPVQRACSCGLTVWPSLCSSMGRRALRVWKSASVWRGVPNLH